ncbi:MAG: glycosyltransferase [Bacteroidales bacterium]|jgi:glycosyltransferase involved in cell wall biosynthesis
MEKRKLYLFTDSFPYSKYREDSFLSFEIIALAKYFDLTIIPSCTEGEIAETPEIKIETNFANCLKAITKKHLIKRVFIAITSVLFLKEICGNIKNILSLYKLKLLLTEAYNIHVIHKWLESYLKKNNVSEAVLYTYWLSTKTLGLALLKKNNKKIKVISRAHRIDLYEELSKFLPFRKTTLNYIDRLYLISDNGYNYITKKYPEVIKKCEVSKLGVKKTEFLSYGSKDGIFRIVSCSAIIPVKRIKLIAESLVYLASELNNMYFEWYHIGEGELKSEVEEYLTNNKKSNLKFKFLGFLKNEEVFNFYKSTPIDVLINVSSSEGVPVSIMEAQSCGIPTIATDVGGSSEIVNSNNGILLSSNPDKIEIAEAVKYLINNKNIVAKMQKSSFENWENNYNAEINYDNFAESIFNLK